MGVPEEIRSVERPPNTVVLPSTTGRYPVRERVGCKYWVDENGKAHRTPMNGKVIGHIIEMRYISVEDQKAEKAERLGSTGRVDIKDWGNVRFCDMCNRDLLELLSKYYHREDATTIYVVAILRACYEGIPDCRLQRQYEETFLTEWFGGMDLSKNTVCTFMRNLGREYGRMVDFMKFRAKMTIEAGDLLVIDGSLQQDNGRENSFAAVSRKTRDTKVWHHLMMYAYSIRLREPICSKVYSGNTVDLRAVKDFVRTFDLQEGILVADRGFPPEAVKEAIEGTGMHFMVPLKRDRNEIEELKLLDFDSSFDDDSGIRCKRAEKIGEDGRTYWFYSYRDPKIAFDEEGLYMERHHGKNFDPVDFAQESRYFGVIFFESDLEMEYALAYSIYEERWLIEVMLRFFKTDLGFDDTREQSDYSVIGSDFLDHLSAVMGSRMLNRFRGSGMLDDCTYGDMQRLLSRAKMTNVDGEGWEVRRIPYSDAIQLEKLGVLNKPLVPEFPKKSKGGRPKGSKDKRPRKKRGSADLPSS